MNTPGSAILVADDEPQLLRLMERVLERAGYAVMTASDGDQARRTSDERRDDIGIVVLDAAIMPHGATCVLESVFKDGGDVGVVLTSGDALPEPLRELLNRYEGIFLRKPFPPNALLRAVEETRIRENPDP